MEQYKTVAIQQSKIENGKLLMELNNKFNEGYHFVGTINGGNFI